MTIVYPTLMSACTMPLDSRKAAALARPIVILTAASRVSVTVFRRSYNVPGSRGMSKKPTRMVTGVFDPESTGISKAPVNPRGHSDQPIDYVITRGWSACRAS